MKNHQFDQPHLQSLQPASLPLSGQALLDLMIAVLEKDLPFRFCARGWSMSPFIRDDDRITITPINLEQLKIGEVFAYVHPNTKRLVVHRAIKRYENGFFFQGDGSAGFPDGQIPFANILGKVTKIERDGRRVRLGLGFERYIIVLFSRAGLLNPIFQRLVKVYKRFLRRNEEV